MKLALWKIAMNKSTVPCAKCGSTNTVLKNHISSKNSLKNLLNDLLDTCKNNVPMGHNGQKFVVCKDCGHVNAISIN